MKIIYQERFDGNNLERFFSYGNVEWHSIQKIYGVNPQLVPKNTLRVDGQSIEVKYPGVMSMIFLKQGVEIGLPQFHLTVTKKSYSYDLVFTYPDKKISISLGYSQHYSNIDREYKLKIDDQLVLFTVNRATVKIWNETAQKIEVAPKAMIDKLNSYVIDKEYEFSINRVPQMDSIGNALLYLILLDFMVIPEMSSYL